MTGAAREGGRGREGVDEINITFCLVSQSNFSVGEARFWFLLFIVQGGFIEMVPNIFLVKIIQVGTV